MTPWPACRAMPSASELADLPMNVPISATAPTLKYALTAYRHAAAARLIEPVLKSEAWRNASARAKLRLICSRTGGKSSAQRSKSDSQNTCESWCEVRLKTGFMKAVSRGRDDEAPATY